MPENTEHPKHSQERLTQDSLDRDIREIAQEARTKNLDLQVEIIQDRLFEHLIEATEAITTATDALAEEKKTRKKQIRYLAAGMAMIFLIAGFTFLNTREINEQRKHSDEVTCQAINDGRQTIYDILDALVGRDGSATPEEEALLQGLEDQYLLPLACDGDQLDLTP